ncbi:fimbrillin family protein [Hallella absiana]|uniref:fimbrillin family protein n=1 Tax=Hallella absiana TaxID=2925336 RepID=UPI0021C883EF|nr:fimbrillin family protein [Hallella absiana]
MKRSSSFLSLLISIFIVQLLSGCRDDAFLDSGKQKGGIAFDVSTAAMTATATDGTTTRANHTVEGHAVYVSKVSASDISLHRTGSTSATTRGEMVKDDNFYDSFHVMGYSFVSDNDVQPKLFLNEDVKKSNNWTVSELWPDEDSYDHAQFYALAPYDTQQITNLTAQADGSMPSFTYTVPTDISEQKDLLAAVQTVGSNRVAGTAVDMKFYHLLTAVDVVIGQMPTGVTINSVTLSGVVNQADFAKSDWTLGSTTGSFTATGLKLNATDNKNVSLLSGKGSYLMMLPQTVPTGAKLSIGITVQEGSTASNYTLSTSIAGDKWQMGHTYTYTISTSAVGKGYILTVSPSNSELGGTGGTTTVNMSSYSYYKGSGNDMNNVDLYAEFQEWDDEKSAWGKWSKAMPSWLSCDKLSKSATGYYTFTNANGNSKLGVAMAFTVRTPTAVTGKHTANIDASVLPSDYSVSNTKSWWDLSQSTMLTESSGDWDRNITTANCYIVSHPGRYLFPLVYGNAINNGQANRAAFNGMKDYQGNTITSERIPDSQISYAKVLWRNPDKDWIRISDNGLTPSYKPKRVVFEIPKGSGVPGGNAVIAAYDSNNTIVWSWHIWLLDTKDLYGQGTMQDIKVTDAKGTQIALMPVNLGWQPTNDTYTYYPRHRVRVRFTQATNGDPVHNLTAQGGQTAMFTIDQHAQYDEASTQGYCPYYQWGRKDPLLGATKEQTTIKTSWAFMSYSLSHPWAFLTNWINNILTSWNNASEPSCIKTIYDPCPVGYHVPRSFAFTGFTADGTASLATNAANIWHSDRHGVAFYTERDGDSKGATIYFPVIDRLDETGTSQQGSIYWTSYLNKTGSTSYPPIYMFIGSDFKLVDPYCNANASFGGYVRPERE